ncbi:MAG: hypothetical protein ACR2HM_11560 [Acidimicrobiales bacterium]
MKETVPIVRSVGRRRFPAVFGVDICRGAADVAHIGGAVVVVIAVIAMAEPVRNLRLLNVVVGAAIALVVFMTDPTDPGFVGAFG